MRVAQFYFKKRFNSVKVLRSHVEQIPIPFVNERKQKKIIAQIDQLLASSSNERVKIYDKIDREISKLYNLTAEEYSLVYLSVDEEISPELSAQGIFLLFASMTLNISFSSVKNVSSSCSVINT